MCIHPVKIDYSDYPKSFISRINEVYFFCIKYRYSIFFFTTFAVECCNRLFRCNQTCYCAGMVSVTSTSGYQSPGKVDPQCTAKVDSTESADVRADWSMSEAIGTASANSAKFHGIRPRM